jgi:hypothetical protein
MELTQDAFDRGAFGSPTFFVNDEMFFGKDQLRDVEEEILAQQRAIETSGAPKSRRPARTTPGNARTGHKEPTGSRTRRAPGIQY